MRHTGGTEGTVQHAGQGEVGRVSPVVRTPFGYDIILMTEHIEEKTFTRDEVMPAVFAHVRHLLFEEWGERLEKASRIAKHDQLLREVEQ